MSAAAFTLLQGSDGTLAVIKDGLPLHSGVGHARNVAIGRSPDCP